MTGEVRKVLIAGIGRTTARPLVRHLETALTIGVEVVPSVRQLAKQLRTSAPETRGILVTRNVASHVAALGGRGDVAAGVAKWNDQLRLAAELSAEGGLLVVSMEELMIRRTGWERVSRFLKYPIDPPSASLASEPVELDGGEFEEITRIAEIGAYRALLDDTAAPVTRRRRPVTRMYHEDEPAYDYDFQEIGARFAARRTLGQDIPDHPDVAFIGSAAVFGRFSHDPFPQIIARETGLSVANLGYGGARPEVYLTDPAMMRVIERARVVVVELMSGRGYENDMLAPVSPLFNAVTIKPAYQDRLAMPDITEHLFVDRPWDRAFVDLPPDEVAHLLAQSAKRLEEDLAAIIARSQSAIVLHLAQEPLPATIADVGANTYRFPHLVSQDMALRLSGGRPFCSVVSKVGIPSAIVDRTTGEPAPLMVGWPDPTVNAYYPSPEMHRLAADALKPLLTTL